MATDIAFAVAVLAVVAPRVPPSLRAFLLTLAIVDDIGAIVVIAVAYSSGIDARWLVVAVAMVVAVLVVRRRMAVVPVTGAALWVALHHAGVHPTLAGVVLGLAAPGGALLERVERGLHRWSSFVIVPLFAFANAGLTFTTGGVGDALGSAVAGGVLLGLVVGKPVGITAGAWASERLGLARRPDGLAWRDVLGAGALGGIGFTVSLFVVGLAFDDAANADAATMGVFAAAALASALGAVLLRRRGAPIVLTVETVEVDDRCPSCGRRLGEILRVRYSGRAVIVHFEVEQDGERIELVHHCGDE
jgi:NhaA family Na+:H+ antiporter